MAKSMASSTPEFEKILMSVVDYINGYFSLYITEMINMLAECNDILMIITLQE